MADIIDEENMIPFRKFQKIAALTALWLAVSLVMILVACQGGSGGGSYSGGGGGSYSGGGGGYSR